MDTRLYNQIGKAVENAEKHGGDLTTKNLKYVWKVAEDVSSKTGVDVNDLFVEGVIAMKKAEEKYDPTKNDNFTKYCATAVRGYMLNVVNRQSSMVHVPVNHLKGFKKGQEQHSEVSNITYEHIDSYDYDTLGSVDNEFMNRDRDEILREGLNKLDESGRIAIKMKLHMDEYASMKSIKMSDIADELEVTVPIANRIYKEALDKLSKYCQAEIGI